MASRMCQGLPHEPKSSTEHAHLFVVHGTFLCQFEFVECGFGLSFGQVDYTNSYVAADNAGVVFYSFMQPLGVIIELTARNHVSLSRRHISQSFEGICPSNGNLQVGKAGQCVLKRRL